MATTSEQPAQVLNQKFDYGRIRLSAAAMTSLTPSDTLAGIDHHVAGKWGEVSEEQSIANENALLTGGKLVSQYRSIRGIEFLIVTDPTRSITKIMLIGEE